MTVGAFERLRLPLKTRVTDRDTHVLHVGPGRYPSYVCRTTDDRVSVQVDRTPSRPPPCLRGGRSLGIKSTGKFF